MQDVADFFPKSSQRKFRVAGLLAQAPIAALRALGERIGRGEMQRLTSRMTDEERLAFKDTVFRKVTALTSDKLQEIAENAVDCADRVMMARKVVEEAVVHAASRLSEMSDTTSLELEVHASPGPERSFSVRLVAMDLAACKETVFCAFEAPTFEAVLATFPSIEKFVPRDPVLHDDDPTLLMTAIPVFERVEQPEPSRAE
jgi:hypothetical protein